MAMQNLLEATISPSRQASRLGLMAEDQDRIKVRTRPKVLFKNVSSMFMNCGMKEPAKAKYKSD